MGSLDNSTSLENFANSLLETGLLVDKYYTPLLCLFGALGNSLSLAVFWLDAKYRSQSASYYLSALAISDTGFLLSLFLVWLEIVHGEIITSPFSCPLVMYLGQVTCFTSVYLIVAFSIERYVAVHYPFSRNRICTKTNGRRVISCLLLLSLILFSYVWVIAKVIEFKRYPPPPSPPETDTHHLDEISKQLNLSALHTQSFGVKAFIQHFHNKTEDIPDDKAFRQFLFHVFGLVDESSQSVDESFNFSTVSPEVKIGGSTIKHCTVPEQYYKISEVANYVDSIVTLIIPFLLITYLNVRIYISIWKYMNERHKIMASPSLRNGEERRPPPPLLTVNYAALDGFRSPKPTSSGHTPKTSPLPDPGFDEDSESSRCEWRLEVQLEKRKRRVSFSLSCCSTPSIKNNSCEENYKESNPVEGELLKPMMKRSKSVGTNLNSVRQENPYDMRHRHTPIEVRVTKTLLLVSTVFLVLNLPLHVIRCAQFFQYMSGSNGGMEILRAIQPWANLLFNTNFAVNFLLYCMSGRNFRNSLHRFITSRLLKKSQPMNLQFSSSRHRQSQNQRRVSRGVPRYRHRKCTSTFLSRINRRNSSNATVSTVVEDKGPHETELVELEEMMGSLFENRSRLLDESTQRQVYD